MRSENTGSPGIPALLTAKPSLQPQEIFIYLFILLVLEENHLKFFLKIIVAFCFDIIILQYLGETTLNLPFYLFSECSKMACIYFLG